MGLLADAEAALLADDRLNVVGYGEWSTHPPYVQVDVGGSAEGDDGLSRADITVRSVTPWKTDPQPQAGRVWRALRSGGFIPQSWAQIATGGKPGERPSVRVTVIRAASTSRWWEEPSP